MLHISHEYEHVTVRNFNIVPQPDAQGYDCCALKSNIFSYDDTDRWWYRRFRIWGGATGTP